MPAALTPRQLAAFAADGFLVVPAILDTATLSTLRRAMAARVADLLTRHGHPPPADATAGDIPALGDNLARLLDIAPESYQHIDISLPMLRDMATRLPAWRALFGADWREQAGIFAADCIFHLITHDRIAAIAAQLLGGDIESDTGGDIVASPVQHVRIKPPQRRLRGSAAQDANTARTLWHQDEAVVTEQARGVDILTVWIAVTDATEHNGCMRAIAGSHLAADDAAAADYGLSAHCPGRGDLVGEIYIPDSAIAQDRLTPLTAQAGDIVLLHKRTIHGAGPNQSDAIRWSFDLRYQRAGTPTGRDCFPATPLPRRDAPRHTRQTPADYRRAWHAARDAILAGEVQAEFNHRWNKYAPMCA